MPSRRVLPLDEFQTRLWAGNFRFYLSLPLERRSAYRRLMKLYLPMLRTIDSEVELHLNYSADADAWYLRRAESIVPDVPGERSLAIARDTAYFLRQRELRREERRRLRQRPHGHGKRPRGARREGPESG